MRPVSRRDFLAGAAAAAGAAALGVGCSSSEGDDRPNVVYVSVDDLGTTLGAYGAEQVVSPHIDAFAARSVLFERCHCQIAICSSSRTSILAGVRPERSGLIPQDHDWQAALPGAKSLPRLFRDQDYTTSSVGKIFDPRGGGPDDCWDDQVSEWGVEDSAVAIEKLRRGGGRRALLPGRRLRAAALPVGSERRGHGPLRRQRDRAARAGPDLRR